LTATGYAQNTDIKWKKTEKSSVGRNWGMANSLVEGASAKITLVNNNRKISVLALDEKDNRKQNVPVTLNNGKEQFDIEPQWKTLWYEIQID